MSKTRKSYNEPGHAHALTFSCYRRLPLFDTVYARDAMIECLNLARTRADFKIWAFVIMPEHLHILVHPNQKDYAIEAILRSIKIPISRKLLSEWKRDDLDIVKRLVVKRKNGTLEHRFWQQGGGFDRNLFSPKFILNTIEYIQANPVRRGLCDSTIEWPWSSARDYAGLDEILLKVDKCEML